MSLAAIRSLAILTFLALPIAAHAGSFMTDVGSKSKAVARLSGTHGSSRTIVKQYMTELMVARRG